MWVDTFKQRVRYKARLLPDILKLQQAHKNVSLGRSPWQLTHTKACSRKQDNFGLRGFSVFQNWIISDSVTSFSS